MSGPTRRARAAGGRPFTVRVSLSAFEMAAVRLAARRAGLAEAAWLGEAGMRAATVTPGPARAWGPWMQDLMGMRSELIANRSLLRNIGANLNAVARAANSTGSVAAHTERVLALVTRAVQRVDRAVAAVDSLSRDAAREHAGGGL